MSSYNDRFDIRDQYGGHQPNCSVFSLKFTPQAFTQLESAIQHGNLQIKFKSESEGKIRFDKTEKWETSKAFSKIALVQDTVVFEHENGTDFVSNYGEICKSFKINPDVKQSFENAKNHTLRLETKKPKTEVIKQKAPGRFSAQYLKKRSKNARERQEPDSTSMSRTPTPPPALVVQERFGDVETRVLHILAIHNNKLTDVKLKELLSKQKLIAGPEMSKVINILQKIASKKNNKCWEVKKEFWASVQKDWPGYGSKERQMCIDAIAAATTEPVPKRKSHELVENSDENGDGSRQKRPRLGPTSQKNHHGRVPKSEPIDHKSPDKYFKPVPPESPAISMSSNGSNDSPNHSEASQMSPSTPPKQATPKAVSPEKPKNAVMKKYDEIKKRQAEEKSEKEVLRKRERARKMSNDEVNMNARRNRLTPEDEVEIKGNLEKEYPCIVTRQEADSYKKKCELDYKRYTELKPKMEEMDARFERYQKEVTKMNWGTPEFQRMYRLIVDDYREEYNKGFLSNKREYHELILRYEHIKRKLKEHYEGLKVS